MITAFCIVIEEFRLASVLYSLICDVLVCGVLDYMWWDLDKCADMVKLVRTSCYMFHKVGMGVLSIFVFD